MYFIWILFRFIFAHIFLKKAQQLGMWLGSCKPGSEVETRNPFKKKTWKHQKFWMKPVNLLPCPSSGPSSHSGGGSSVGNNIQL